MKRKNALVTVLSDAVERQLEEFIDSLRTACPLFGLIDYHMGWSKGQEGSGTPGKKARPLVLLLVNQALGGDVATALPVAAAVELLHSAALALDDIQDESDLRRGRPALWRVCGPAQAINVGVALQAAVHLAVARAAAAGLPPARALVASEELGLCTLRLCEGQHLDLSFEGSGRPSIDDYMRMCGGKTASLVASASYLGAFLAGHEPVAEAARRLGYHLGMYLQIEDDIAGIWGDAAAMGKLPADLRHRKKTLPLLYVFQLTDLAPEVAELGQRFFSQAPLEDEEFETLRRVADELGGRSYAEEMAGFHRGLARRAADELGEGRISTELIAVLEAISSALAAPV